MKLGCHACRFFQRDIDKKHSAKKCTHAYALMGEYWCGIWGCIACFNPELRGCKNYEPKDENAPSA